MKQQEDILIISIRYCISRFGDWIKRNELATHLSKETGKEYTANSSEVVHIFDQIIDVKGKPGEIDSFGYLKTDAYYHLIEYDAAQSANILARKS